MTQTISQDNRALILTSSMTKLLTILVDNHDRLVSSVDIFFHVWDDYDKEFNPKNVRNLISNLRKRIPCLVINNYYGGRYVLKKYRDNVPDITDYVLDILDQAKNGITISDPNLPDNPIIFVNEAFSELFEYTSDEVIGRNCRFLHGEDRDQTALKDVKDALNEKRDITVILRNYTKSGELIFNELTISPIFDKKTEKLKYFLGVQKNVTAIQKLIQQIKRML
ncbi:MAG: PAS domain-containing protein [Sulfurimonas sp.]|nr:PAS domain-containing protein [Sulfurimonas sp.]MDD3059975.1 PAS domain-containing protein [Sulfurimonas sp.]MDD5201693.1 PAS domain-containing protein [Sulfurimonas sp.]